MALVSLPMSLKNQTKKPLSLIIAIYRYEQRLPTGGSVHAIRLETADWNGLPACGIYENQLGVAGAW